MLEIIQKGDISTKNIVFRAVLSLMTAPFFLLPLSSCGDEADTMQPNAVPSEPAMVVAYDGQLSTVKTVTGRFYCSMELESSDGVRETLYQFRSDDDEVWWLLSAEEIGYVPEILTQSYCLTYDNGGTTKENKTCGCPPEDDCECEVYDDVFLGITPVESVEPIIHLY